MDLFSNHVDFENLEAAKQLFKESREWFLKLFNNSPVCMSMTTPQRTYVRVNKKFLERFGYTEEEIIGRNSIEVGILDTEESLKVGALIKEKGRLQNDYVKCIAKGGEIVHTVSSIELMEMNGESYLVSFFIDVSKMVEQQSMIEQQLQQLNALNKELEAFSYSVSHDLRAPLRAINGYTKILEEDFSGALDSEGRKVLSTIQQNAAKMGQLIDDLLAFAKMGKRSVVANHIDMNVLVREVADELKNAGTYKTQIIVGDLHPAKGDLSLIRQVVINLLSNGVKYSSKKEQPLVEVSSRPIGNMVEYTVKDNGEGFDMQYADRLFGVFQRLHSDEQFEGTGVGLAMVQRILNKHGGSIEAEAAVGVGATFRFTLPA